MKIFSVFDSKVGAFLPPMYMRSALEAIRSFSVACCTQDHMFYKHAEDFTLFEVGEWDELTCAFNISPTPRSLCTGIEASSRHKEFYFAARQPEVAA